MRKKLLKKIYFHSHLIKLIKKKKGKALDLACGVGYYSRFLSNHDWSVDAVDSEKSYSFIQRYRNIRFYIFDLEKNNFSKLRIKLVLKNYDLILISSYLYRPLFNFLPNIIKKNGHIFLENFMIKSGQGKLKNKEMMYKNFELTRLNIKNAKIINFWQGVHKKNYYKQSAIFYKT